MHRAARWLLPCSLLTLLAAIWGLLVRANRFVGHDEAVYANRARSLVTDLPDSGWLASRPPALPLLAAPVLAAGGGLTALRVLGVLLAAATLAVTYLLAARWSGRATGALAVLTVLAATGFLRRLPELLTDIPAAGMLLATTALLVARRRGGPAWYLPAAAAVAAVAFELRFGVISSLAAIALAVLLVDGPRVWWQDRRGVALAALVWCAGFVPHLLWSWSATGSPIGALRLANQVSVYGAPGSGLVGYVTGFAGPIAGPVSGTVILLGLGRAAQLVVRRLRAGAWPATAGADERWLLVLVLAALLQVLVLGIPSHAEARYVFFALLALATAGGHAVVLLAGRLGRRRGPALGLVAAVLVAGAVGFARWTASTLDLVSAERELTAAVGTAIGPASSRTVQCLVVTDQRPELGWYTGCQDAPLNRTLPAVPASAEVNLVVFDHGDRPAAKTLDSLARLAAERGTRPLPVRVVPGRSSLRSARITTLPAAR